jgi:hypothetical protein
MTSETLVWSEDLRQQTRTFILEMRVSHYDGMLHFKHADGHFAICGFQDLLSGRLILTRQITGQMFEFDDIDALLNAGWVID